MHIIKMSVFQILAVAALLLVLLNPTRAYADSCSMQHINMASPVGTQYDTASLHTSQNKCCGTECQCPQQNASNLSMLLVAKPVVNLVTMASKISSLKLFNLSMMASVLYRPPIVG